MSAKTSIEWTEATWNPLVGCSVLSPGCAHCYAMKLAGRLETMGSPIYRGLTEKTKAGFVWNGTVELSNHGQVIKPLSWRQPRRVFVNSMSDLFHESVPDEWIDRIFAVMALCPQHTFQVLTKRAERMRDYLCGKDLAQERRDHIAVEALDLRDDLGERRGLLRFTDEQCCIQPDRWPLPNVWVGVSVEDQARVVERIPLLLNTPAAVRWISAEPLLGPVDLRHIPVSPRERVKDTAHEIWRTVDALLGVRGHGSTIGHTWTGERSNRLDWAVCGSESGQHARPCDLNWVRSLRDQCIAADVPFFWKQDATNGRKISTPELDGKRWVEYPDQERG